VARLNTLSARRKKPERTREGRGSRYSFSSEWLARVAKSSSFSEPPSALKPSDTASASSSVLLPLPFSPTKKVTDGCSFSPCSPRTAGREKG